MSAWTPRWRAPISTQLARAKGHAQAEPPGGVTTEPADHGLGAPATCCPPRCIWPACSYMIACMTAIANDCSPGAMSVCPSGLTEETPSRGTDRKHSLRGADVCQSCTESAAIRGPVLPTNHQRMIKKPDRHLGDQASDLHFLVAGAGFEPATSGL